jgi:hypothetical protein
MVCKNVRIEPEIVETRTNSKRIDENTLEIEIDQTINLNKIAEISQSPGPNSPMSPHSNRTLPKSPISSGMFIPQHSPNYQGMSKIEVDETYHMSTNQSRRRSVSPAGTPIRLNSRKKYTSKQRQLNKTPSTVQKVSINGNL